MNSPEAVTNPRKSRHYMTMSLWTLVCIVSRKVGPVHCASASQCARESTNDKSGTVISGRCAAVPFRFAWQLSETGNSGPSQSSGVLYIPHLTHRACVGPTGSKLLIPLMCGLCAMCFIGQSFRQTCVERNITGCLVRHLSVESQAFEMVWGGLRERRLNFRKMLLCQGMSENKRCLLSKCGDKPCIPRGRRQS